MTFEDYYGEYYPLLKKTEADLLEMIGHYPADSIDENSQAAVTAEIEPTSAVKRTRADYAAMEKTESTRAMEEAEDTQPIIYCKSRIKSPESMVEKLKRSGLPTDSAAAMANMHDAVGIRVICSFLDNVYQVADWLTRQDGYELVERKDYISYPKPNGYRSLHLILRVNKTVGEQNRSENCNAEEEKSDLNGLLVEIQLRTIAIDSWAALEHQMKYKHSISNERMIREELKRCADEIASVDMSMQTIRDAIRRA